MRTKSVLRLLLVLSFFLGLTALWPPAYAFSADTPSKHVLLLYDSLAKGTPKEGNIAVLQRMLAAYGAQVTVKSIDQYQKGSMQSFSNVITVVQDADFGIDNASVLEELASFPGDYLHIGPRLPSFVQNVLHVTTDRASNETIDLQADGFGQANIYVQDLTSIREADGRTYGSFSMKGSRQVSPYSVSAQHYTYVPYFEKGNASELAMANVLKNWLGISANGDLYLVMKEIYPFSDLTLLENLADELYEAGIPFLVSVRPVFSNTDFPAMKRYIEALRYVQSKNGSIAVNAPVVNKMGSLQQDATLQGKMEDFIGLLAQNGVAPLAIGSELYWTYDEKYAEEGMGFFDSAVLFPDEEPLFTKQTDTSKTFHSALYSVQPGFLEQLAFSGHTRAAFPMDTAVTFDFFKDKKQMEAAVQRIKEYWVFFADYKQSDHEVHTGAYTLASSKGMIALNRLRLNLEYTPQRVNEDYEYVQKGPVSFTRFFHTQNYIFIVIILIALTVFWGLFIVGKRMYRQKFLK